MIIRSKNKRSLVEDVTILCTVPHRVTLSLHSELGSSSRYQLTVVRMMRLLDLPRELRDRIYHIILTTELPETKTPLQLREPGYSPFATCVRPRGSAAGPGIFGPVFAVAGEPADAPLDFARPRTATSALLSCNRQVRNELREAIQRLNRQQQLRCKLDITINRQGFFPSWLLLPAPVSHIDTLEVRCRIMLGISNEEILNDDPNDMNGTSPFELGDWMVDFLENLTYLLYDVLSYGTNTRAIPDRSLICSIGTLKLNFTLQENNPALDGCQSPHSTTLANATLGARLDTEHVEQPSISGLLHHRGGILNSATMKKYIHHWLFYSEDRMNRKGFRNRSMVEQIQKIEVYIEGQLEDEWDISRKVVQALLSVDCDLLDKDPVFPSLSAEKL